MTMKYKVGDKAVVREWDDMAKEFGVYGGGFIVVLSSGCFVASMRKYCGKTVTIKAAYDDYYLIEGDNTQWHFTNEMFVAHPQLIIEHHGRTTVAHIGKTYGVARCNPDDEYDAMTGDIIAVQRLYAKVMPKKIIGIRNKECYGIIGAPSPFKDVDGNPLKVGDCVNVNGYHRTFIACNEEHGFFVMGWGLSGENFNLPLRKVDDYDHEYYPNFKVIPCQQ